MGSTSSTDLGRLARSVLLFNRTRPVRYYAIDVAIFGFPLVLAAPGRVATGTTLLAFASMSGARLGGLTIDDYFDRVADAVENPERPIPADLVSPREALVLGAVAMGIGLVCAALVGPTFLGVEVLAYVMLFASFGVVNRLDVPLLPTAATVTSVSMLTLLGWVAHGALGVAALAAFLVTWSWDWAHDAIGAYQDRAGDEAAGIATVGVVLEPRHVAAVVAGGLLASFVLLCVLLRWQALTVVETLAYALLTGGLLAVTLRRVVRFARRPDRAPSARRAVEWYVVGSYALATVTVLAAT
jgi:4-hydroxybenzoate polyprenyltransferase